MSDSNYQLWLRIFRVGGFESHFHTDLVLERTSTSQPQWDARYLSAGPSREDASSLDGILIPRGPTEGWGYLKTDTRLTSGTILPGMREVYPDRDNIIDGGRHFFQIPLSVSKRILDYYGGDHERLWRAMVAYGDRVSRAQLPYRPLSNNSNTFTFQTMSIFDLQYGNRRGYGANKQIETTYDPVYKVVTSESGDGEHVFVFDTRLGAAGYHQTPLGTSIPSSANGAKPARTVSRYFDTPGFNGSLRDRSGPRVDLRDRSRTMLQPDRNR